MKLSSRVPSFALFGAVIASSLALSACAAAPADPASEDGATTSEALSSDAPAKTYTVGGTVKGLAGPAHAGLTLEIGLPNGDVTSLLITKDGSFVFPKSFPSGTRYTIAVQRQPLKPPQLCKVTHGTGTIGKANVTNVLVDCSTAYTVGGTVSGLLGKGLELTDGVVVMSVAADGSFTFPRALPNGATYQLTFAKQPTSPSQTCAMTNSTGKIAGASVTDVAVTCTTNTSPLVLTVNTNMLNAGLVLQNVTTNESWDIPGPGTRGLESLTVGQGYTFEITSPPRQSCTLSQTLVTPVLGQDAQLTITCEPIYSAIVNVNWAGVPCSEINFSDGLGLLDVTSAGTGGTFSDGMPAGASYALTFSSSDPSQCICLDGNGQPVRNGGTLYAQRTMPSGGDVVSITCAEPIQ